MYKNDGESNEQMENLGFYGGKIGLGGRSKYIYNLHTPCSNLSYPHY